jgi:hypothetical protein
VNVPFTSGLAGSDDVRVLKSQTVVVYCGHGPRAWLAGEALRWREYARVTLLALTLGRSPRGDRRV